MQFSMFVAQVQVPPAPEWGESDVSDRSDKSDEADGVESPGLIPTHGGYRNLRRFQVAEVLYDGTVLFCNRWVDKRSRTHDQMVQSGRSGRQNIAEGSMASATSKKTELKLTNVAKASQAELLLKRQIRRLERDLVGQGGFTEKIHRVRTSRRRQQRWGG